MAEPKKKETKPVKKTRKKEENGSIRRSMQDRMIAGVCGGFAEYLNVDVTIVRVIWFVALFFGGLGLAGYILAWIIIPESDSNPKESSASGQNTALLWGLVLIFVGAIFLFRRVDWYDFPFNLRWRWHGFWPWEHGLDLMLPLAIILFGVYYLVTTLRGEKDESTKTTSKTRKSAGGSNMEKRLTRSKDDRMLGGVCGGFAKHFDWDPSLVRIGFALLSLFLGSGILGIVAYVVMLIVIPEEGTEADSTPGRAKPATGAKK